MLGNKYNLCNKLPLLFINAVSHRFRRFVNSNVKHDRYSYV